MDKRTILDGHDSPETAFVVEDYPYGFRLRCQMRVWVESNKHGQRVMRQTSNPKRPGTWNKPKASTYAPVVLLALDDAEHVTSIGVSGYSSADELRAFEELYFPHLNNEQRNFISYALAHRRAEKHVTYTIQTCSLPCTDETHDHQTSYREREKRNREIMHALTADELRKESNAALAGEEFDR